MTDLFDKYKPLLERMQAVEQAGSRIGPVNEKIVSPTRAIIDGRDTILAGTNNYMGITFEP
jgi:8-amino-7-oxononanoate synthase